MRPLRMRVLMTRSPDVRRWGAIILFLFAVRAAAAPEDAADVALLVNETDAVTVERVLTGALASPDALVRATAARVAGVRDIKALAPVLRDVLARETDFSAAREQIRAVILLGDETDV